MKLNEIFYSIQGEGANTGTAAVFIRFCGCNLKCKWCDTDHSFKMEKTPQQIAQLIDDYPKGAIVVLTGGEPLLQTEMMHLLDCLAIRERYVAIETNGTIYDKKIFKEFDWVTVSPKAESNYSIKIPLGEICELKYIMDENLKLSCIPEPKYYNRFIYLQPMSCNEASIIRCVDWVQKFPDRFKLSLQTQKLINIR